MWNPFSKHQCDSCILSQIAPQIAVNLTIVKTTSTCLSLFGIDSQRSMLQGIPRSAICVQKFDDSLSFAIRTTYRISLRSSSLREPRYPLLKVVQVNFYQINQDFVSVIFK